MISFEILSTVIGGFLAVMAALVAVQWQRKALRERAAATLEVAEKAMRESGEANETILGTLGRKRLTEADVQQLTAKSPEVIAQIRRSLNHLEYLAVGVNESVFDVRIIDRLIGAQILAMWFRYLPFIHAARVRGGALIYQDLERLVHMIQARRQASPEEVEAFRSRFSPAGESWQQDDLS